MKVRLTQKDVEVLMFLARYKMIKATECKKIYNTNDYHRKRLKLLEKERYIRRVNRYYIKLDIKGTKLVKEFGYNYNNFCRNQEYMDRINAISKIATLTLNSDIKFIASWDLKDNNIFTETSRKFLGQITYQGKDSTVYYIDKDKKAVYIRQIINDIQKVSNDKNVLIFIENLKIVNKSNQNFTFGKSSTIIINPTSKNLELIKLLQKVDIYQILTQMYNKEILLSDCSIADYMTEDEKYIIMMPFIDTEKLHRINIFCNKHQDINRKINIVTFKDNEKIINEILNSRTNIITLDNYIGGLNEEEH